MFPILYASDSKSSLLIVIWSTHIECELQFISVIRSSATRCCIFPNILLCSKISSFAFLMFSSDTEEELSSVFSKVSVISTSWL